MKDKIIPLIIGILIGAIITAAGFLIFMKTGRQSRMPNFDNMPKMEQFQGSGDRRGTPPDGKRPDRSDDDNRPT